MRIALLSFLASIVLAALADYQDSNRWQADILPEYEHRHTIQPRTYDGECISTIIRRMHPSGSKKAYLYVHGFNDYFFQTEMGTRFIDSGFNFYAVDLRRYGRSLQQWQYPFDVRDLQEYFSDIDSALTQIRRDGNNDITLSGHSTGGLIVAYMAAVRGARIGVNRIVTNSPFLEWNFNAVYRNILIPLAAFWGKISPSTKINQGNCNGYAHSLLKQYYGEWTYDTTLKMPTSPPVTASWINAINKAQGFLHRNGHFIIVPVLVMHSSRKVDGCDYTPSFQKGDAVLNPQMIHKASKQLGSNPTIVTIANGMHDLILSPQSMRNAAYDTIFNFIRTH